MQAAVNYIATLVTHEYKKIPNPEYLDSCSRNLDDEAVATKASGMRRGGTAAELGGGGFDSGFGFLSSPHAKPRKAGLHLIVNPVSLR